MWVGVDEDKARGRGRLAQAMEAMYQIPYERFEKYSPFGEIEAIADFLAPYREAGCRLFNIMPVADSTERAIDAVCEIKERLSA